MKKIFKNPILMFVLGILVSGIGVYAASAILASNVTYTPSDSSWNVNNTASALDNLYDYYETSKYVNQKDCVQGTVICNDRCVGSEGLKITNFMPTKFSLYMVNNSRKYNFIFNEKYSSTVAVMVDNTGTVDLQKPISLLIKQNTLTLSEWGEGWKGVTIDYVACK